MTERHESRKEPLERDEFMRLSVEDAMDVLERYPNLRAVLKGTVSHPVTEWPAVRTELQIMLYSIYTHIKDQVEAARCAPSEIAPGCKLVPLVPTAEMEKAAALEDSAYSNNRFTFPAESRFFNVYVAMLRAVPPGSV